jgi:cyclohexyl-isocyanide hydratase
MRGFECTTHWMSIDRLAAFGAKPVHRRVVVDRNRITGGGVTAGIDFALAVAAEFNGETVAREIQLQIEYAPEPPFPGSPATADAATVATLKSRHPAYGRRMVEVDAAAALKTADAAGLPT